MSYYCLCLLFNKIGEESRIGFTWKQKGWRGEGGAREGARGKIAQTMYAHMSQFFKIKKIK
jgi:hypothetical protein